MAKKVTTTSATEPKTDPVSGALAQDGTTQAISGVATTPSDMNGSDGTNTPESEADGGAGTSASPSLLADINVLADLLAMTGCADRDDLIDMALVGRSLMNAIATHVSHEGPLENWSPAQDPAEVVGDLVEQIEVLQDQLTAAKTAARASEPSDQAQTAKRSFVALSQINLDNELVEVGGFVLIDEKQHAALAASDAVDRDWNEGF